MVILTVTASSNAFAEETYSDLYRRGAYSEALLALEDSPDAKQLTPDYFFNRGVIHHALQQEGLAVAYLEKAHSLSDDPPVIAALQEAQRGLAQLIGASKLDPASYIFEKWGDELPLEWAWMALVSFSILGVVALLLGKSGEKGRFSGKLMNLTLFLMAFAILVFSWDLWMSRHPAAMVAKAETLRSGPGESYLERGVVDVGMKLRLVSPSPVMNWYRVRFDASGEEGFIPAASLLLLTDQSHKS